MLLGITEATHESQKIGIQKKIKLASIFFTLSLFLPFIIYGLFQFEVVPQKAIGEELEESVAFVVTSTGTGTAFLISPTILLTARHVIEDLNIGDDVEVIFKRATPELKMIAKVKFFAQTSIESVDGKVPAEYFLEDVAVLEIPEILDILPLALGESELIQNLDDVILMGYPNGDYSATKGNINSDKYHDLDLFKLDATSNPGNSGGPCFLEDDHTVIGILVGGSAIAKQGENIAIKIDNVKKILDEANIDY